MRIKQRKVSMVKISSAVEDVFDKLGEEQAMFDDNGGDPDGALWLVPEDDLSADAVLDLVRAGDVDIVEGDIVEYDGRGRTRAILDAAYPDGWCGFSSRGEAYGWQAKQKPSNG